MLSHEASFFKRKFVLISIAAIRGYAKQDATLRGKLRRAGPRLPTDRLTDF